MTQSLAGDNRDPVEVVAEEFIERLRRGEHPSISDYARKHPAIADQLREVLPGVAQMEQLKRFRKATSVIDVRPAPMPTSLGDFRIVRELGRGGMGVVYEAIHESLGRRVALKVLPHRGPKSEKLRDRFLREAQAAAKLHHTNIVPVFGVGEQDGVPYYVMQLIRGFGLNTVISDWKMISAADGVATPGLEQEQETRNLRARDAATPREPAKHPRSLKDAPKRGDWAFIARAGAEAAEALDAAHEQGVLHRDVKPGNLLLDHTGRVWVADFGLAKMLDKDGLTETGDVLGTLPYMPPEAFHGRFDPRGDVYGLGATLYEMLTLATPFTSDTPAGMIRQIDTHDPSPPSRTNPEVPRDLETIVLKALARDPEQRYETAGELAEDLRAFLEDRPIQARRSTWVEQAQRWTRRNPTIAWLSGITVAALLLAAGFGWAGYARAKKALVREEAQRKQVEETNEKMEGANSKLEMANKKLLANLTLSLEAFERLFDASTQEGAGPGFFFGDAADKLTVLETVLNFYDKFAEQNATNPNLQFQAGRATRRVGEMQVMLGREEKGEAAFRRAASILEPLSREFEASEPVLHDLMLTYAHAPRSLFGKGVNPWTAEPLTRLWTLERQREGLLHESWMELGLRLGVVLEDARDLAGAERVYREVMRERIAMQNAGAMRPFGEIRAGLLARLQLAGIVMQTGRPEEAKRLIDMTGLDSIIEDRGPMPKMTRDLLSDQLKRLAEIMEERGDIAMATRLRRQQGSLLAKRPDRREGPPGPGGREGEPDGMFPKGPYPKGPRPKGPFGGEGPPPPPPHEGIPMPRPVLKGQQKT